jgi:hypothetical protein
MNDDKMRIKAVEWAILLYLSDPESGPVRSSDDVLIPATKLDILIALKSLRDSGRIEVRKGEWCRTDEDDDWELDMILSGYDDETDGERKIPVRKDRKRREEGNR